MNLPDCGRRGPHPPISARCDRRHGTLGASRLDTLFGSVVLRAPLYVVGGGDVFALQARDKSSMEDGSERRTKSYPHRGFPNFSQMSPTYMYLSW